MCLVQCTHHNGGDGSLDAAQDVEAIVVELQLAGRRVRGVHNCIAAGGCWARPSTSVISHVRFALQWCCHCACAEQNVQQHSPDQMEARWTCCEHTSRMHDDHITY